MNKEIPLLYGSPKDKSIINPEFYINYLKKQRKISYKINEFCIICYNPDYIKELKKIVELSKLKNWIYPQSEIYNFKYKNISVTILLSNVGAPITGMMLEELIILGAKYFISIGDAGSIQKQFRPGHLVIPDKAIRDEGTSYHYCKPSKYAYPSKKLTTAILESCRLHKIKFYNGTSWTTDAPYRETIRKFKKYNKERVFCVEMELAALFTIAKFRKVDIGAIIIAGDLLSELEWEPLFHKEIQKVGKRKSLEIALDAFLSLKKR